MSAPRARWPIVDWFRAHPLALDTLLAIALLVLGLVSLAAADSWTQYPVKPVDGWALLLVAGTALPLALRRRMPVTVVLVVGPCTTALMVGEWLPDGNASGVLVALYTVGTLTAPRRSLVTMLATLVMATVSLVAAPVPMGLGSREAVALLVVNLAVFFAAWMVGRYMRTRRAYIAEVEARALQGESERAAQTRAAIAEERERIAREMHDVVAHHVSVMVVSAAAARRTVARDPAQADGILASVETSGRAALADMRRLVGFLRGAEEAESLTPPSGVADIATVVEHVRDAGVPVTLTVHGDATALPQPVEATAYRIVQEALTNVLKHARASSADVHLHYGTAAFEVTVSDDGAGATTPVPVPVPVQRGHGILGMRERVSMLGGTLRAGPLPSGGFEVHARLPLERVPA